MGIEFDLDVCAPTGGIPWIPAARYFTMADDGLAQPWEGRVWMNPPYSQATVWVNRFIDHGNGVALLPCAKSRWFETLWTRSPALTLAPGVSKFRFHGEKAWGGSISYPVILAAFGDECVEAIGKLGVVRVKR